MVTVPANELIRRSIKFQEDDPRMPAILEDDAAAKSVLKSTEGVNWSAAPEPKKPRPPKT